MKGQKPFSSPPFAPLSRVTTTPLDYTTYNEPITPPVEGLVGLLAVLGVALQAPVDDVDGGPEPGPDPVLLVNPKQGACIGIKTQTILQNVSGLFFFSVAAEPKTQPDKMLT